MEVVAGSPDKPGGRAGGVAAGSPGKLGDRAAASLGVGLPRKLGDRSAEILTVAASPGKRDRGPEGLVDVGSPEERRSEGHGSAGRRDRPPERWAGDGGTDGADAIPHAVRLRLLRIEEEVAELRQSFRAEIRRLGGQQDEASAEIAQLRVRLLDVLEPSQIVVREVGRDRATRIFRRLEHLENKFGREQRECVRVLEAVLATVERSRVDPFPAAVRKSPAAAVVEQPALAPTSPAVSKTLESPEAPVVEQPPPAPMPKSSAAPGSTTGREQPPATTSPRQVASTAPSAAAAATAAALAPAAPGASQEPWRRRLLATQLLGAGGSRETPPDPDAAVPGAPERGEASLGRAADP